MEGKAQAELGGITTGGSLMHSGTATAEKPAGLPTDRQPDFSGWATKFDLKCSDGRTITKDAFAHQDKMQVPLVWQHAHDEPTNVLGHAILEQRDEGVYAYGYFNETDNGKHAKALVEHGDIDSLSIFANQLKEKAKSVLHGVIREVSLVMARANPGALIDNLALRHADGEVVVLEDEAVIYTGLELQHEEKKSDDPEDGPTVQEVYDGMNDDQKAVVQHFVEEAVKIAKTDDAAAAAAHSALPEKPNPTTEKEEGRRMKRNVFENHGAGGSGGEGERMTLSHDDMKSIAKDAVKRGSLKAAVESYALAHGIESIDVLFPDARAISETPEFDKRRTEWVSVVLNATRHTPFSRIKSLVADLTHEDARAKGYIKGNFKKEEFFEVASRTTTPTTIYKKQKLDRDDIVDITDFDVVGWMRAEMKVMIKEELARAILLGDGRAVDDEDKIVETNIRPIVSDHELYSFVVNVNLDDAMSNVKEAINAIIMHRQYYRGTGMPTMYTTETFLAQCLILADGVGRDLYDTVEKLATKLRVKEIVTVELMDTRPDIVAILVNPADYVIGMTRGGELTNFEDFDIDFNQHKYLIETRLCGALAKLKSAMIVKKTAGSSVLIASVNPPTFNTETGVVTIVATTNVTYKNDVTNATLSTGAQAALADGATLRVRAEADSGFHLASTEGDTWQFTFHADA